MKPDLTHVWKGQTVEITFEAFDASWLVQEIYDSTTQCHIIFVNIFMD